MLTKKYMNASSCRLNGSARCTPNNAVSITHAMKKPEKRVRKPNAKKMPPKNSDNPAAHAKTDAAGKPISPVLVMNCSDGGSFPYPWPKAIATPAKILNNVNPAFAAYDNPDSPPKSMLLSNSLISPGWFILPKKNGTI